MRRLALATLFVALCWGCSPKNGEKSEIAKSYHFSYVQPPIHLVKEEVPSYMRDHFWDNFDFTDTLWTTKADTTEMLKAYAAYVAHFVGPLDQAPIRKLMQQAAVSKSMFNYFAMLSERLLHDPNSPYRSDELYIAVLEAQLASPHLDKYEKMVPEYDLRVVSQNRLGHRANDFDYTTKSGKRSSLYSLKSEFTIIYINNPGCAMCRDITEALKQSKLISDMQKSGRLKVLAIYPDEDLDEWHKHHADMPSMWINGYDRGCRIERENLYNVGAIPALYLLDREKIVLVKDSVNVGEIEAKLSQQERG